MLHVLRAVAFACLVACGGPPAGTDAGNGGTDAGPDALAQMELTFDGCAPDFSGDLAVVPGDPNAISIGSFEGGALISNLALALGTHRGSLALSTAHASDTGVAVYFLDRDSAVWINQSSVTPDPVSGTLIVDTFETAEGRVDVTFDAVTLARQSDGAVCTIEGRARAFRVGGP